MTGVETEKGEVRLRKREDEVVSQKLVGVSRVGEGT